MSAPAPRRPLLFAITVLVCIVMAWGGVAGGCSAVGYYKAGTVQEPSLKPGVDTAEEEAYRAWFRAERQVRDAARSRLLPLSIGNLILSGLLLVAATRAFGGRRGSRELLIQAVAANAALVVVEYMATRHVRGALAMAFADHVPQASLKGVPWEALVSVVWTFFRLRLFVVLGIYGLTLLGLTREATLGWFEARALDEQANAEED